jgi:hypothetical protein
LARNTPTRRPPAAHLSRQLSGKLPCPNESKGDRMTEQDLNDVIAGFREALRDYVKGDPEPAMSFFSDWDDVTLANPLEPPR